MLYLLAVLIKGSPYCWISDSFPGVISVSKAVKRGENEFKGEIWDWGAV